MARRIPTDRVAVLRLETSDQNGSARRLRLLGRRPRRLVGRAGPLGLVVVARLLVAEDPVKAQPDGCHQETRLPPAAPKAIKADDAATRLLTTAVTIDTAARHPWPARDLALVALFLVSGIREGEAVALGMVSIVGPAGARRLGVTGKGNKSRAIPIDREMSEVARFMVSSRRSVQTRVMTAIWTHRNSPGHPIRPQRGGRRAATRAGGSQALASSRRP